MNVYVGEDEKLHFVDRNGADSVLPFNKGGGSIVSGYYRQSIVSGNNNWSTFSNPLGKKFNGCVCFFKVKSNYWSEYTRIYDVENNLTNYFRNITEDTFEMQTMSNNATTADVYMVVW